MVDEYGPRVPDADPQFSVSSGDSETPMPQRRPVPANAWSLPGAAPKPEANTDLPAPEPSAPTGPEVPAPETTPPPTTLPLDQGPQ